MFPPDVPWQIRSETPPPPPPYHYFWSLPAQPSLPFPEPPITYCTYTEYSVPRFVTTGQFHSEMPPPPLSYHYFWLPPARPSLPEPVPGLSPSPVSTGQFRPERPPPPPPYHYFWPPSAWSSIPEPPVPYLKYPLSPAPKQFHPEPRSLIMGGFTMSGETAAAWAQREFKLLAPPERQYKIQPRLCRDDNTIKKIIKIKVAPYGAEFMQIGEGFKDLDWMIVTQSAPFSGYVGMDPQLIPQFQEGSREEYARGLLAKEGFSELDYEFKTVLE
ncbi:hypothetical protein BDQ12DRAFT_727797 [Crucibulum laeve]|uniref:Uncharacterized protein n=1 Tax=Crucibulum laeve TaxID=68775 RepID=A0A5C3LJL1_9AGAR|nr:hypothetical protein BDQ12DRAFT_727797 [Crucibulum laeve]